MKQVQEFRYNGSILQNDRICDTEIRKSIEISNETLQNDTIYYEILGI